MARSALPREQRTANLAPLDAGSYNVGRRSPARLIRESPRTMKLLILSLESPAANLALDEALLEQAEAGAGPSDVLRLWEPTDPCVVVGCSSRVAVEVKQEACRQAGIPVLRRCSGGAAVVTGPGCLMYSVVLSYRDHPAAHVGSGPLPCADCDAAGSGQVGPRRVHPGYERLDTR